MVIEGECLCGKVGYQVVEPLINASHCHCSMCRRQHGAAFATYAAFHSGKFSWTFGSDFVDIYEVPTGGGWCFCKNCGSTLAGTDHGIVKSITLGTVKGNPGIKAELHIFTSSKAPWYDIADDLPQFEQRP